MANTPIRVGVIGTGIMGAGHARFLTEHVKDARVSALMDVDESRMGALAKELGDGVATFTTAEDFYAHPDIDAVIIASPDALHVPHLRLALAKGLPTLCEKPIATTVDDARTIVAEVEATEKRLGKPLVHLGFMRRFDPSYVKLKKMLESGEYGAPLVARISTRNVSSPGITTPGLYTNMAVHDFDIWRWLTGDNWDSVVTHYPKSNSLSPAGLKDPLIFVAQLKGGITMVADVVANDNYGYDVRTEVICEKGSVEMGIFGDIITRHKMVAGVAQGGPMVKNWIPRFEDAYIEELKAWIATMTTGVNNPNLATAADGLAAAEACQMGVASLN